MFLSDYREMLKKVRCTLEALINDLNVMQKITLSITKAGSHRVTILYYMRYRKSCDIFFEGL